MGKGGNEGCIKPALGLQIRHLDLQQGLGHYWPPFPEVEIHQAPQVLSQSV